MRLIESKKTAGFCWSEEPGSSSARQCDIGRLELCWWHIPQTGMQPLGIIHLLNEDLQIGLRVGKRLIFLEIHLLLLEGLEKTFGLGIVIRITHGGHANLCADLLQLLYIVMTSILHAAVGMMDQTGLRVTLGNGSS